MKGTLALALVALLPSLLPAAGPDSRASVSVARFFKSGSPTSGIQDAVNSLPAGGGIVFIPAGEYTLVQSVTLPSGVRLQGEGSRTRLVRRDPCVQARLAADAPKGSREVKVESAKGFAPGKEVTVYSEASTGWWATHAIIVSISGDIIRLDRELTHDCLVKDEAGINNFFPAVYAKEQSDIRIEDILIDGRMEQGARFRNNFTFSAVHFDDVRDATIARVHVKAWPGDGISAQRGDNVTVSQCISEYCLGHGFHPGTGITSGAWIDNIGRYNGWDGLFFCHRVRHSTMRGNRLHDNGWSGIGNLGLGGVGGDRYNVVSDNFCWNNGRAGIECTQGGNNTVVNNVCENNSREQPGKWPGILVEDTYNTIISGNRCLDFQEEGGKTQGWGIYVSGTSRNNIISGNLLTGHIEGGIGGPALWANTVSDNLSLPVHEPAGM